MSFTELLTHPAISLLIFLIGLLVGNWTAIGRDRRKEFNDAAGPLVLFLVAQQSDPSPYRKRPTIGERYAVEIRLNRFDRNRFISAWKHYEVSCEKAQQQDELGQVSYGDTSSLLSAINKCLKIIRLR